MNKVSPREKMVMTILTSVAALAVGALIGDLIDTIICVALALVLWLSFLVYLTKSNKGLRLQLVATVLITLVAVVRSCFPDTGFGNLTRLALVWGLWFFFFNNIRKVRKGSK